MNPFPGAIGRKVTAGGGGGAVFAYDTFTGTNGTDLTAHTGETGATWAKVTGTTGVFKITSNRAKGDSGVISLYYASGTPDTNEYDIEVDCLRISGVDFPGVGGRIDHVSDSGYYFHLALSVSAWNLVARSGGVDTLLDTYSDTGFTDGVTRHLKLEIRNSAKKAYIDGVEVMSSADNSITWVGNAGIRTINSDWGFGSTGRPMDNFTATNAS